jgi:hypothetical protein
MVNDLPAHLLPWRTALNIWWTFLWMGFLVLFAWHNGGPSLIALLGLKKGGVFAWLVDFVLNQAFDLAIVKYAIGRHWGRLREVMYPRTIDFYSVAPTPPSQTALKLDNIRSLPLPISIRVWWSFFWRYNSFLTCSLIIGYLLGYPPYLDEPVHSINKVAFPFYVLTLIPCSILSLKWALESRWNLLLAAMRAEAPSGR